MARKGWDALSDAYRARLQRGGVTQSVYESGTPLARARGHVSPQSENFRRQTTKFAKDFSSNRDGERTKAAIRAMGPTAGKQYMAKHRKMVRLYEAGHTDEAHEMWEQRDKSVPDYLYWYHGRFS